MISVKNSYEIAYNGTENECRFEMYADTAADLQGLTHIDGIKIQMGSECTDISTGDKYILNGSGVWVLQPSANAWENVYTKAEIDSMITEIYDIIAYYHTTLVSDTGEIAFYSLGGNVGTWVIYGNGQKTGTPTPDNPVMPTFCGVRTANLFDKNSDTTDNNGYTRPGVEVPAGTYSIDNGTHHYVYYRIGYSGIAQQTNPGSKTQGIVASDSLYVWRDDGIREDGVMLNLGSTALPYEPYGWAEKITCAGQTVPVYLGQTQTVRRIKKLVLVGNENWMGDAGSFYADGVTDYLHDAYTAFCSHFPTSSNVSVRADAAENSLCFGKGILNRIFFKWDAFATARDLITYLSAQYAAGTPVCVWYVLATPETAIVNEPLAKIGDYADELHSEDAGVTIPTVKGSNTLTVDTTLKPSKIEISGER